MSVLVVDAEVNGAANHRIRVDEDTIVAVGSDLRPGPGDAVLDARGGAVIPGLHDHHVHLRALDRAARSVDVDPATLAAGGGLAGVLAAASTARPDGQWLRAVGWRDQESAPLDRCGLDRLVPDRPVRVQDRRGALWVLNSAAARLVGLDSSADPRIQRDARGMATGRLWRMDDWLRERIAETDPSDPSTERSALAAVSRAGLNYGITGYTDATPDRSEAETAALTELVAQGTVRQRLTLMGAPGLTTPEHPRVQLGPMKLILDDDRLPSPAALADSIRAAHHAGTPVAIHAVTAEQLIITVAAVDAAGPMAGDRVEHAGIVPPGFAEELARLNLIVVTQPGFISARGDDYRRDVEPAELDWLYPCASLIAAGVTVAGSTDAPFGPSDPWVAIATAASRRTSGGVVLGALERIPALTALRLFLGTGTHPGRARSIAVGQPGDLCLLDRPLTDQLADPSSDSVRAVVTAAAIRYRGGGTP